MVIRNIFLICLCIFSAYGVPIDFVQGPQSQQYPSNVWANAQNLQLQELAEQLNHANFDSSVWSERLKYANFNPVEWSEKLSQINFNPSELLGNLGGANVNPEELEEKLRQVNFNPYGWAEKLSQLDGDYDEWENTDNSDWQVDLATKQVHPNLGLNVVELIDRHGYLVETHTVTTEDGYILSVHRIPGIKNATVSYERKPTVLVMAGVLCGSADWVLNGPGKALAYLLSDAGYDVWLGNNRGTTWSREHVSLNPKNKKYWDFSYHEMGVYDLPANIDYILEQTQQPKLFYIAHSQGATSFFVMASERPQYNDKIRMMSALAPVTYSSNVKNPFIRLVLPFLDPIMSLTNLMGIKQVIPHSPLITSLGQLQCNDDAPTQDLCPLILFLATGFDEPQMNKTMLPVIFSNFPAGGSMKQFWHFAQTMKSRKFRQFDYGLSNNLLVYGQKTPPEYKLAKVTAPVATYYSTNDWISSDKDVRLLMADLPNVVVDHLVGYENFNHLDYMWATDAKPLLYDHILQAMQSY